MQAVELVLQAPYRTAWAGVTLAAQSRVALIEARDCLAQAIPWQRAARAVDPVNSEFTRLLYKHHHDLVVVELLLGNHRGAAAVARELPAIVSERAEDYVLAAECLARCLPLVAADAALDTDQRGKLTAAYAAEAVRLLQAAVNNGFRGADELKRLPVYEPLRRRADFQQLLDDLDKNRPRIG